MSVKKFLKARDSLREVAREFAESAEWSESIGSYIPVRAGGDSYLRMQERRLERAAVAFAKAREKAGVRRYGRDALTYMLLPRRK